MLPRNALVHCPVHDLCAPCLADRRAHRSGGRGHVAVHSDLCPACEVSRLDHARAVLAHDLALPVPVSASLESGDLRVLARMASASRQLAHLDRTLVAEILSAPRPRYTRRSLMMALLLMSGTVLTVLFALGCAWRTFFA